MRVASPEAARALLAPLGARLLRARHFEDNVLFDDAQGSLARSERVLRLRRAGGKAILTFKGPAEVAGGVKSREELELEISDPSAFERILAALGLSPRFRYQKYRESYAHDGAEVVIDETPIGTFLEIEGSADAIHSIAAALGFAKADYLLDSYVALFLKSGKPGEMVFP